MLKLGERNISKMYLGGQAISKAYLGSNLVYSAAKPLPYDYEVAYIERDCGKNWLENGSVVAGGFNLSEYLDGSSMMTATRPMEARWSSDPIDGGGNFWALGMTWNAIFSGAYLGRSN